MLLLVSSDSLASDYFYGKEVEVSLERHKKGETVVVPVILRHCDWEPTPLGALEALPEKGRPVVEWPTRDQAFQDVVRKLRRVIEGVQQSREQTTALANALRQYTAACLAADHLFSKERWEEARRAYQTAMPLFLPGFSPDQHYLEQKLQEIDRTLKQAEATAIKAKKDRIDQEISDRERVAKEKQEADERLLREQEAAQIQRENEAWLAALAANTPAAFDQFATQFSYSSYAREARRNAKALRRTDQGSQPQNNRLFVMIAGGIGVLLLVIWLWPKGSQKTAEEKVADTEASDYAAAKATGTLPALEAFIAKSYPKEAFEAQAKADSSALQKRYRSLIKDAKNIAMDSRPAARLHLDTALMIMPNDPEAIKLMEQWK